MPMIRRIKKRLYCEARVWLVAMVIIASALILEALT